jgi:hypothetical protein
LAKTGYRIWGRERWRCATCIALYPDPHHWKPKGMGGVADEHAVDERNVLWLCRACHRECHSLGRSTFTEKHQDRIDIQAKVNEAWDYWMALPEHIREDYEARARGESGLEA